MRIKPRCMPVMRWQATSRWRSERVTPSKHAPGRTGRAGAKRRGSAANEVNARGLRLCALDLGTENCHSASERMSLSQLALL